jgi:uncharacterized protein YdeI (YjbR/CyaY-like superfamily)
VKRDAPLPTIAFETARDWEDWLEGHHSSSVGLWLKLAKKSSKVRSITYPEAVEGALAWGWIDGQKKSFDDQWWLQKFTPRGPRSIWSKLNVEKATALIAARRMKPPGLRQIERAKRDGRWKAAYDSAKTSNVPRDLAAALAKNARARAFFATLESRNRYAILFRIQQAKKPETRAERIARFVTMLAKHQKLHP